MGLLLGLKRGNKRGSRAVSEVPKAWPPAVAPTRRGRRWVDTICDAARSAGRAAYVVDGYFEVTDAVRRGHRVVLRRQQCEVADGVQAFPGDTASSAELLRAAAPAPQLVAVVGFDAKTACYVMRSVQTQEAPGAASVRLTPRRLQRYLSEPHRSRGVALA